MSLHRLAVVTGLFSLILALPALAYSSVLDRIASSAMQVAVVVAQNQPAAEHYHQHAHAVQKSTNRFNCALAPGHSHDCSYGYRCKPNRKNDSPETMKLGDT